MAEMAREFRLETERLVLRDWRESDLDDMQLLGEDPKVMATLGPLMTREKSQKLIADLQRRAQRFGHTFWALERTSDSRMIGFTGLSRGRSWDIAGELEIGWRLASDCWGEGYATEAAQASLDWAREHCPDPYVIAITSVTNTASRAVMERLGMRYDPARDFDHPQVPEGDPLRPHVLYELEL
jgi:RimJ/RimL family protein N-acetyltransferase